jgi:transposase
VAAMGTREVCATITSGGVAVTREEKVVEVRRRVLAGESPYVVGPDLGVSKSTVYAWVYPERYSEARPARAAQKRQWENEHDRARCHCGALMGAGAHRQGIVQCQACHKKAERHAKTVRRDTIAQMWQEGMTLTAIAQRLGSTVNSIGTAITHMRAEGWDLPYRRADKTKAA